MSSHNRGCWFAISRCFNSRAPDERNLYSKVSTENIEFEDLATAERNAADARRKKQVVTETEREHIMNGKLDDLVEHQRRMDEERDAQLKKQEEALRREEEAYYAAKREAANKRASKTAKVPVSLEIEQADQSDVGFNFPVLPPILPTPMVPATTAAIPSAASVHVGGVSLLGRGTVGVSPSPSNPLSISQQKDDEDFDQFLENVKVKQLSITTKSHSSPEQPPVSLSDSEEEIDFGFWEKAPVLAGSNGSLGKADVIPSSEADKHRTESVHELDLGLL